MNSSYVLTVKAGVDIGRRIERHAAAVLGRLEGDITIADPEVSRRHAAFRVADGVLIVEDLGSRNGTKVNGARIDGPTSLSVGDSIDVGDTQLELESISMPAPAAPETSARSPEVRAAAPSPVAQEDAPAGAAQFRPAAASRHSIASRRLTPALLSFGTIVVTAIALLLYFVNAR